MRRTAYLKSRYLPTLIFKRAPGNVREFSPFNCSSKGIFVQINQFHPFCENPELRELVERAQNLMMSARSPATRKGYARDFLDFEKFCAGFGFLSMPAEGSTIALYLAECSKRLRPTTIARRLAAIAAAHKAAGYDRGAMRSFVVEETHKGIRRTLGVAQHGKAPLLAKDVCKLVANCPNNLLGRRDRALILIGFGGGFRRSELSAIGLEDVIFEDFGVLIALRKSKTDQEGEGRTVAIRFGVRREACPVEALRDWIAKAHLVTGPVFRGVDRHGRVSERAINPASIARLLKRAASRAGLGTAEVSAHSLRAGLVTQASLNGISLLAVMEVTGHRTMATVRRYYRPGQVLLASSAAAPGL